MRDKILWSLAILFYGIGDLATTYIGFQTPGVVEANPVALHVWSLAGIHGFLFLKGFAISTGIIGYLSIRAVTSRTELPRSERVVPVALLAIGIWITFNNIHVLYLAT